MKKIFATIFTICIFIMYSLPVLAGDIPESLLHSEDSQLFFGEVISYHPNKEKPDIEVSPVAVIKGDVNSTDIFEVTTYNTKTLKLKNVEGNMWERFEKYLNEGKYGEAYIEGESSNFIDSSAAFPGLLLIEGIVMCFVLLIVCVIGIANGPVGLVVLYEDDVQERVIELGYTTKEKIRKSFIITCIALFAPVLILAPFMVYGINGATGFWDGFWQMTIILLIAGLFDRFFIDWYWVARTKAWIIPGTEDLQPYIPTKVLVRKWIGTIIGYPMIAAVIAGVLSII